VRVNLSDEGSVWPSHGVEINTLNGTYEQKKETQTSGVAFELKKES